MHVQMRDKADRYRRQVSADTTSRCCRLLLGTDGSADEDIRNNQVTHRS